MEVQVAIGRENSHGVEQADKGDSRGVLDGDTDTGLRTRWSAVQSLEEQNEQST